MDNEVRRGKQKNMLIQLFLRAGIFLLIISCCFVLFTNKAEAYVHTSIDETTGAITANGMLFYPKVIWVTSESNLDAAVETGFNVGFTLVANGGPAAACIDASLKFLDAAHNAGMYGLLWMSRVTTRDVGVIREWVQGIKHHPALLGIRFPDEGTSPREEETPGRIEPGLTREEMLAAYKTIKDVAPDLLVSFETYSYTRPKTSGEGYCAGGGQEIDLDHCVTWADVGDIADMVGIQYYPFLEEYPHYFHEEQRRMNLAFTAAATGVHHQANFAVSQGCASAGNTGCRPARNSSWPIGHKSCMEPEIPTKCIGGMNP
jgi:hypothetical protein